MSGSQTTRNTTFLFSGNPTFLFGTYMNFSDNLSYVKLWRAQTLPARPVLHPGRSLRQTENRCKSHSSWLG
jgi:hypothetical protein